MVIAVGVGAVGCGGGKQSAADNGDSTHHSAPDTIVAQTALDTSATQAAPPEPGKPDEPPQIFRGYLVIEAGRQTFKACGTTECTWIVDLTGQQLSDVYDELAINPGDPVFVEVEGLLEPAPDIGFGADHANQITVLELRRAALEGPGCNEDLRALEFRARGNEPFWRLDITKAGITFSDFGRSLKFRFPYVAPKVSDEVWRYDSMTAGGGEHRIIIDIEKGACNDSMSGAYFRLAAEVEVDNRTYVGCALQGW